MLEDHSKEKSGCHTCQSTTCAGEEKPAWDGLLWTQSWGDVRSKAASGLQDYVDHITESYGLLQLAVGDTNLHLLKAWTASSVQELKRYFMGEEDVSCLCLMINTEWEKLAFAQDAKVNNPSTTKNVMGES